MKKTIKLFLLALIIPVCFSMSLNAKVVYSGERLVVTCSGDEYSKIDYSKYSQAKRVTIKGCSLSQIPNELFQYKNLEYLNLANNQISYVNDSINKLTKLKTLDISNNQIKNINDVSISSLQIINASGNNLTGFKVDSKKMNKITRIDISNNGLTYLGNLKNMSKLSFLDISDNQLIKLPSLPKNIKTIDASNNYLISKGEEQYTGKIKKQNKIAIESPLSEEDIYNSLLDEKNVKRLLVGSQGYSISKFKAYEINFIVNNKTYNNTEFIKLLSTTKDNFNFKIQVKVKNSLNEQRKVYDNNDYGYSMVKSLKNKVEENIINSGDISSDEKKVTIKEKNTKEEKNYQEDSNGSKYTDSYTFKILSIVISALFFIPVIGIIIIYIVLTRFKRSINKAVYEEEE